MDYALVIGADTRPGEAISRRLLTVGFRVFGLGRDFSSCSIDSTTFVALPTDLSDLAQVYTRWDEIQKNGIKLSLLVHAAQYLPSQSDFSKIDPAELDLFLRVHTVLPLFTARLCLTDLVETHGNFIYIAPSTPITGAHNQPILTLAAVEPVTAALNALQSQYQDTGIRITRILPETFPAQKTTSTPAAPGVSGIESQHRLDPEAVADVVESLIIGREGNFPTEIRLRPRTPLGAEVIARSFVKPTGYQTPALPPAEKMPEQRALIATQRPDRKRKQESEPVTYTSLVQTLEYDEEAELAFEKHVESTYKKGRRPSPPKPQPQEDEDEDWDDEDDETSAEDGNEETEAPTNTRKSDSQEGSVAKAHAHPRRPRGSERRSESRQSRSARDTQERTERRPATPRESERPRNQPQKRPPEPTASTPDATPAQESDAQGRKQQRNRDRRLRWKERKAKWKEDKKASQAQSDTPTAPTADNTNINTNTNTNTTPDASRPPETRPHSAPTTPPPSTRSESAQKPVEKAPTRLRPAKKKTQRPAPATQATSEATQNGETPSKQTPKAAASETPTTKPAPKKTAAKKLPVAKKTTAPAKKSAAPKKASTAAKKTPAAKKKTAAKKTAAVPVV